MNISIDKLIESVRSSYGKDKGKAEEVSSGSKIIIHSNDDDFITWKNSPWSMLTGIKGIPFGRIVQIAGKPDSGKSTHAMQFMKLAQDQDVLVIFWDSEKKFMASRFKKAFAADPDKMIVVNSRVILEGADRIERIIHEAKKQDPNVKILVVWDSIGGTLAGNEAVQVKKDGKYEGGMNSSKQMALAAKENGAAVRGLVRLMETYRDSVNNKETIATLLINQSYSNIGAPGQKQSGGQKVEYHSSLIVTLARKANILKQKNNVKIKEGILTRASVYKNHLFDGDTSVHELDLIITNGGIALSKDVKLDAVIDVAEDDEFDDED